MDVHATSPTPPLPFGTLPKEAWRIVKLLCNFLGSAVRPGGYSANSFLGRDEDIDASARRVRGRWVALWPCAEGVILDPILVVTTVALSFLDSRSAVRLGPGPGSSATARRQPSERRPGGPGYQGCGRGPAGAARSGAMAPWHLGRGARGPIPSEEERPRPARPGAPLDQDARTGWPPRAAATGRPGRGKRFQVGYVLSRFPASPPRRGQAGSPSSSGPGHTP